MMSNQEPIAKLMSGGRLPYFVPFPSWNFAPWNHHAPHSIPKIDLKWKCLSSTQSFAIDSHLNPASVCTHMAQDMDASQLFSSIVFGWSFEDSGAAYTAFKKMGVYQPDLTASAERSSVRVVLYSHEPRI